MTDQTESTAQVEITNKDEKMWGMLCHLSALAGFVIPFGNIIGPLVIWMLKKDEFPHVNDQGKESLNFQISLMIYIIAAAILIIIAVGILLLIFLAVYGLVMIIIASLKANEGVKYRYPFTIRLIN